MEDTGSSYVMPHSLSATSFRAPRNPMMTTHKGRPHDNTMVPSNRFGGSTSLSYLFEPPDFSLISNGNLVVTFKNLLKKDATTKSKALEDLVAYAAAHPHESGGTEDAVLDAWIQLYPRTSIDNARRVRELSHAVQLELMKSARKRMEKRIPSIVGAWLAGTFDKDHGVARVATKGLASFLNSDEKMTLFWRKCQGRILEYACESITETPDTLSDERSTTKEDSLAKYHRVMGGALSLVLNLMKRFDDSGLRADLDSFLAIDAVWSMAAVEDSYVRRTVYQLLQVCLNMMPDIVKANLPKIGRTLIADALMSSQSASAADLVKVLTSLTRRYPEVWGTKKQPLDRVRSLVEKGSQGSSWIFWQDLDQFLEILPQAKISENSATSFLRSMRVGMSSRQEPRAHAVHAWACYINTFGRFTQVSTSVKFLEDNLYPLTRQFLHPTTQNASWSCLEPGLLPRAWDFAIQPADAEMKSSIEMEWTRLADSFVSRMQNSLPEVSADFHASQKAVGQEGDRWFTLADAISSYRQSEESSNGLHHFRVLVFATSSKVVREASSLLRKRDYKPYGAAMILQSSLTKFPQLYRDEPACMDAITTLFTKDSAAETNTLLNSSSAAQLVAVVNAISKIPGQTHVYGAVWKALIDSRPSASTLALLLSLPASTDLARHHGLLQERLRDLCLECASSAHGSWDLFETVLSADIFSVQVLKSLAVGILEQCDGLATSDSTLKAMSIFIHKAPKILSADEELHLQLVTTLLALTELSDSRVAAKATALRLLLDQQGSDQVPLSQILKDNLEKAGQLSLDINTLVKEASSASVNDMTELFPSSNTWMTELARVLQRPPNPSLSLMSILGGAYFEVKTANTHNIDFPKDLEGRTIPARMALYTLRLLSSGIERSTLPSDFEVELLYLLSITTELAADQLVLKEAQGLWDMSEEDVANDVQEFISSSRTLLNSIAEEAKGWQDGSLGSDSMVERLIDIMLRQCKEPSPMALYSAKALSNLLQALTEVHGFPTTMEERFLRLDIYRATPEHFFPALAFLTGFRDALASSKAVNNLCNKLVSDITGAFPRLPSTHTKMVLLNTCLSVYEAGQVPVDQRRMVIALKQITSWTDTPDEVSPALAAEICRGLQRLAPSVAQIYGPYWEQAVIFCLGLWAKDDAGDARLAYLQPSIKLITTLESLPEPNDDLAEALHSHAKQISDGLLQLLKKGRRDRSSHAADIVDATLCRRVARIPLAHLNQLSDLYDLVASNSRDVQTAAFALLHRAVPEAQKSLSLEVVLDKKTARLPDELLSLLLDPPTLESYSDDELAQLPNAIRGYLLAWHLIFDALESSSYKLRSDYVEHLKTENAVSPLLDFMFDVLGHSEAKALNIDKERFTPHNIQVYDVKLGDAESDKRNMQWLLIHIFYQILKYSPGLFKAWYLDCRSKQTKIAVEAWTQKYFSPLIINEALDAVATWQAEQEVEQAGDDEEGETRLVVRVNRRAREIVAGYEVDETEGAIAVRVPPSYPIGAITVDGIKRVAVGQRTWEGWLLSTRGAINFAGGTIVDGLTTFRRNVVGAMKGHTECAICYSIVSSDKRVPDKRCGTCKNSFHSTCLYKWFQRSGQNSCPLCRNPIDFLGADSMGRKNAARGR